ncbi:MAG TPA: glycosyltransferase family 2 protein [Mycobacteriales bacterium]|nr:glycosyltransferase family 2 protein [Mycobacteriales bacterium]
MLADPRAVVTAASIGFTAYRVRRLARFGAARHRLVAPPDRPRITTVSAVVPARDEARHIAECLEALCLSGPDLTEVVVVDDASRDGTALAASRAGPSVRVLPSPGPQVGQLGKPVACAAGAATARGEWLWFVDADVRVAPDLLNRLLRAADERDADLVSAVGRLVTVDPLSGWLLPAVGLAVARRHDPDLIADPTSSAAFAAGPCLLIRRSVYNAVGGHLAVADQVVEDVALARLVKAHGGQVVLATTLDGYSAQMYDDARACWVGLLKNTSAVRSGPWPAGAAAAALGFAPVALLQSRSTSTRRLAAVAVAAQVVTDGAARARARQPVWPAALSPLTDLLLAVHHAQARWLRHRGRPVGWRGRPVPVG